MPATKQQIRQIIADNNLNSVADVYSLLRDSFKDILVLLLNRHFPIMYPHWQAPLFPQH